MEETAVWFDMPGLTTIESVGTNDVPLDTTGHEKNCITVALTTKASGDKSKPFVTSASYF